MLAAAGSARLNVIYRGEVKKKKKKDRCGKTVDLSEKHGILPSSI